MVRSKSPVSIIPQNPTPKNITESIASPTIVESKNRPASENPVAPLCLNFILDKMTLLANSPRWWVILDTQKKEEFQAILSKIDGLCSGNSFADIGAERINPNIRRADVSPKRL